MKRMLCILSSLDAGGAETFVMKVLRSLPSSEFQIDFIVSVEGGCYTQEVLERGGRIFKIPLRTKDFAGAFAGIYSVVRKNEYTCVLKLGENALAAADLIAARLGGAKKLALRSCNAPTKVSFAGRCVHGALRPLLNFVATIKIAPSVLAAEYMFGKRAASRDVVLLNNGVDLQIFSYDAEGRRCVREEFSLADKFVVGHLGAFRQQKNHLYLLEVFREIRSKREDAVLLLVGIGALEQVVRDRAKDLGVEESVIFAGRRFDIPQLLSAMDVMVFPSFYEGMPNAVIEAQATGLSCVVADTITKEADITGLVSYLSLEDTPVVWADVAINVAKTRCKDARSSFVARGYDISTVSREFVSLFFKDCCR